MGILSTLRNRRDPWGQIGLAVLGLLLVLSAAGWLLVDPENPSDSLRLIGRLHPLLVHFPIGFVLLAAVLEALSAMSRAFRPLRRATAFVLFVGAASALLSVTAGFFLSLEGGYDQRLVTWHKWLGLMVAAGAVAAFALKIWTARLRAATLRGAYMALLAATVVTLAVVGHLGGSLTHGPEYLTYYLPAPVKQRLGLSDDGRGRRITNVQVARIYPDLIAPVLQDRCVNCHGPTRDRGGLRLDTVEGLMKGGEDGPVVVPGSPEESELWRRVTLPLEHEDVMPPDGAEPLSIGETELIRWWILHGASPQKRVSEIEEIPSSVATLFARIAPPPTGPDLAAFDVPRADPGAIRALRSAGFGIQGVAEDLTVLQVSTFNVRKSFGNAELKRLLPLAEQVTWLDLAGTRVEDSGLSAVARMPHLTRLHLEHTAIGDAGLRHLEELEHLEYLNLVGTRVTDAGLRYLENMTTLKVLYLWQTRVTKAGVKRLQDRHPELRIVTDTAPS